MQTVHTHSQEYPSNLYNRTPEEIISERRRMPKLCDCNRRAIEYLNHRGAGGVCCTKCNIVYELHNGYDQALTMFKDLEYEITPASRTVTWDSGKSSGTLTIEMNADFYRIERFIRRSSRRIEKHPQIICETISKPVTKRELYEEAYWKFVNAVTYEDAIYWKKQMESQVDLALEPGGDNWVSWVKDPEVKKEIIENHFGWPTVALFALAFTVMFILAYLGIV